MEPSGISVESLRSKLIGQLQQIADIDVLKAIESLVKASQAEHEEIALHPVLREELEESIRQYEAGEPLVDNEQFMEEIDQWLKDA